MSEVCVLFRTEEESAVVSPLFVPPHWVTQILVKSNHIYKSALKFLKHYKFKDIVIKLFNIIEGIITLR